ncbi:hypothetical protein GCM10009765_36120 [Fodinicola feengrottensis]|uniref:Uncharacterized protein n=1 Tax=Fodinicola feengrottensis TaxID=435914 RepID=A0ABN2H8G2_9ACTN
MTESRRRNPYFVAVLGLMGTGALAGTQLLLNGWLFLALPAVAVALLMVSWWPAARAGNTRPSLLLVTVSTGLLLATSWLVETWSGRDFYRYPLTLLAAVVLVAAWFWRDRVGRGIAAVPAVVAAMVLFLLTKGFFYGSLVQTVCPTPDTRYCGFTVAVFGPVVLNVIPWTLAGLLPLLALRLISRQWRGGTVRRPQEGL